MAGSAPAKHSPQDLLSGSTGDSLFGLEGQKTTRPGGLDGSIKRLWEWRPEPYWGQHPTRVALMRRFIAEMENCPATAEWKEEDVKRHFQKLSRSLGVRIVRLPSPIRP